MAITDVDRIGLLIGAGSMGKRHAKILAQKYSEVIVVDRDPTLEVWVTQELRQQDMFFPDVESALSKIGTRCSQVTAIIATVGPDHLSTICRAFAIELESGFSHNMRLTPASTSRLKVER